MKMSIDQLIPLLCPPGNGVFTVNTAKERKEKLHLDLYKAKEEGEVLKAWKKDIKKLDQNQVALLGVCSDCGGGIQRGANWGPLYIRQYLYELLSYKEEERLTDLGDIRVIPHLLHDKYLNEATLANCRKALYDNHTSPFPVSPLSMTEFALEKIYESYPALKVITLGGDHSVSYPATKAFLKHKKKMGKKVAIIHFDAHTDLLKERLGIDLCFGSWCTHILEDLPGPDHLIQLGIRSSGKERGHWESSFGVQQFWNDEFNKDPLGVGEKVLNFLKEKKVDELYVSFDIDALDESEASATGTPETNGLKTDDCLQVLHQLTQEFPITGADLMEVAPHVKAPSLQNNLNPEPETTLTNATSLLNFFLESMWRS